MEQRDQRDADDILDWPDGSPGAPPGVKDDERLVLEDWQILFGYASYFESELPMLDDIARMLVEYGVAESAYVSDGDAWWATGDPRASPAAVGKPRPHDHGPVRMSMRADGRRAKFNLPSIPRGYALETLVHAAALRYHELFLFGHDLIPPRYVRAYLGKVCFADDESALNCYPQLKIFENGVVLCYFRTLSPPEHQSVARFIRRYINAPLTGFRRVLVPPGIAYWSTLAAPAEGAFRWFRRPQTAWYQYEHRRLIRDATIIHDDTDFAFPMVSMSAPTEAAVIKASENAMSELAPQIIAAAKRGSSLDWEALENEEALVHSLKENRREGEPLAETAERLQREVLASATAQAEAAGEAVKDAALSVLRKREETFSGVALTIMAIAGYVIARPHAPRPSLLDVVLNGSSRANRIGHHWGGHHHVDLIRFRNQGETAGANDRTYGAEFGSIVARTIIDDPIIARTLLPESSRLFDDIGAYISLNGTLWVQSRMSLKAHVATTDPNNELLVDEHHVKAELLDYSYALHRRIAQDATADRVSLDDVFAAQRDLADFELALHDSSHFGEIRDLIGKGLDAYGIRAFRARMSESIRVREAIAGHNQARKSGRLTMLLSLVAGFLAVPPLASEVIKPLWKWRGWWLPGGDESRQLMYVGAAVGVVACVLIAGSFWAQRLPLTNKRERVHF